MSPHHLRIARTRVAMWAGMIGTMSLLIVLLVRGWGSDAWGIAAGVLLVVCFAVCGWAAVEGERSDREVRRAVARLAEQRRQAEQAHRPSNDRQGEQ